jgi:HK97 family phage major capsid protein
MHDLVELRHKRDQYLATAKSILDKAIAESRGLTADEQKDIGNLREKAQAVTDTIKTFEELRGMTAGGGSTTSSAARAAFTAGGATPETRGPFSSLGEQLRSIQQAAMPGTQPDARLFEIRAAALNEGVPSEGGFLVQQDFTTRLLDKVKAASKVAVRCTEVPVSGASNGVKLPALDESNSRADGSRHGGVLGYWLAEAGAMTATKPKFRAMELTLKKVGALVYATDELLADATALESFVSRVASAELAWQVDNRIIRGSGAGCPLGILESPALIEVPKETGQEADSIVVENVLAMFSRLPASSVDSAVWYVSQSVFPQLYSMGITIGVGGSPLFMPAGSIAGKPFNTLLGLPVVPIEQAAKLGDKGDIMLCDMSRYLLATKGGIQSAASIHVQFLTDETAFRFIMRVDGQPDLPGPVTPYNGGPTESPFIVLAAR